MFQLLQELIAIDSVSPNDKGCQKLIANHLRQLGFRVSHHDRLPVSNLWAHYGNKGPLLVFAGHTDVVPAGDPDKWQYPPYQTTFADGKLYGRGTCDMKGALWAMMEAAAAFIENDYLQYGQIGFLITSGEEGDDFDKGTPYILQQLIDQGINIDACIVGEPSSSQSVGDTLKVGRRGSLTGYLTIEGKQGHVAYPHLAINPIHQLGPFISALNALTLDEGNRYFDPSSLQISNISSGTGATNVIPADATLSFNIRYSPEVTDKQLINQIEHLFYQTLSLTGSFKWQHNGTPFLTKPCQLTNACQSAIEHYTGKQPKLSTSGGTSDARFIAPHGIDVIELGPVNATIHQINEHTDVEELKLLSQIYRMICKTLLQ